MLNNIKLIGVIFLSILLLTNCKKDVKDTQQPGELVFAAIDVNADSEKDGIDQWDIMCNEELVPVKARVNLNGTLYYPALFMSEGKLLTQSIKLPPGDYTIYEFSLLTADDIIVKSTPMAGSDFAGYVGNPIDDMVDFTIEPFVKNQFEMDVLCYLEAYYESFGFEWFEVTEITIREQCFFGDFCIKDVNQYTQSLYGLNGVTIDEKAIFLIRLNKFDNDLGDYVYYAQFSNFVDGQYVTGPLCVEYADYDATEDLYQAELWIYVTSGETWDYVYFHTWNFKDDESIEDLYGVGNDGVVDFVLGNCVEDPTDLLLPPWMNLPAGPDYTFSLSNGGVGPDAYWHMSIGGITSPLYDMQNVTNYPGWCADEFTTIGNGTHCMDAISSLYPEALPTYWLDYMPAGPGALSRIDAIAAANWLWNHEGDYVYTYMQMQNALWNLFNNKVVTGVALTMATDARMHTDFSPLPGGWAAIYFIPCNDELELQMTFFVVDP